MKFDDRNMLPDNVKSALDEKGQDLWMNAFNKTVRKSNGKMEFRKAVYDAWNAVKDYNGCRYFAGLVSTEALDKQNDVVLADSAFKKIAKHIERGGVMVDTHTNRTVGSFFFVEMTKSMSGKPAIKAHGVIYQGEPYYDSTWEQIKKAVSCPNCNDVRKGYSIGGFATDTRTSCDAAGCHRDITDMSIHEISVCQDPANPEALIMDVNAMAKCNYDDKEQRIDKSLRLDEPAAEETSDDAAMGELMHEAQTDFGASPAGVMDFNEQLKMMTEEAKKYKKFKNGVGKFMTAYQDLITDAAPTTETNATVAEPSVKNASCGCVDEDVHTQVDESECDADAKLYGDVKDPAVKGSMKYLENKDIEACPCADGKEEEEKGYLPGKPDFKEFGFKTAKVGPVVETKIMTGYDKLKPKNASDGKHESGMTSKEFASKYATHDGRSSESVTPQGGKDIQQMGKETGDMIVKCDGNETPIPKELLPAFQEFLQGKGIKIEPKVNNPEIEEPIMKTLLIIDGISEMDLRELSHAEAFDTAEALGKVALLKSMSQRVDMKLRLAKTLQITDLELITPDSELSKAETAFGNTAVPVTPNKRPLGNRLKNRLAGGVSRLTGKLKRTPGNVKNKVKTGINAMNTPYSQAEMDESKVKSDARAEQRAHAMRLMGKAWAEFKKSQADEEPETAKARARVTEARLKSPGLGEGATDELKDSWKNQKEARKREANEEDEE